MSSSEFRHYTRDEFLAEFYPDPADKAAITAGMEQLRAEQRAFRLAEMRQRLGSLDLQFRREPRPLKYSYLSPLRCGPIISQGVHTIVGKM